MGFSLGGLLGGAAGFVFGGPAGAAAGYSIGSGLDAQQASSDAASAQVNSANQATALQKAMFDKQVELNAPFRAGGLAAQNRLMTLLGLGGNSSLGGGGAFGGVAGAVADALPNIGGGNSNSPDFLI